MSWPFDNTSQQVPVQQATVVITFADGQRLAWSLPNATMVQIDMDTEIDEDEDFCRLLFDLPRAPRLVEQHISFRFPNVGTYAVQAVNPNVQPEHLDNPQLET